MQSKKIVFLASDCESSRWVYNALINDFTFEAVIIESPIGKLTLVKRRLKKMGVLKVFGQVIFSSLVVPFLKLKAKERKAELVHIYQLNNNEFSKSTTFRVHSVNDDDCKLFLEHIQPHIVVVNGTRIISKRILQCTQAVFINMHVGITPLYRGSHGGYWALYNNDAKNFGTTIHLIDAGVDTGAVLKQVFTLPGKQDNFVTYPILQTAIGIEALKEVLHEVISGNYEIKKHTEKGRMYYQPTIWQYFFGKLYFTKK
jgi:folate-dependent phosphoribosylglycinamide formyltransferase PurN